MSVDFEHTVDIDKPALAVFEFLAEFENNPSWQQGMHSCQWTSPTRGAVGSTYVQVAQFMGRRIDTHFVVTEFEPGRLIAIESTQSTVPIQVTRRVEPLDAGRCRVIAHVRGQPSGLLKIFSGMVRKNVEKDSARLRERLAHSVPGRQS